MKFEQIKKIKAFEVKKRDNGEEFVCFTDEIMAKNKLAPDFYVYEVLSDTLHNIDCKEDTRYEIVSRAWDIITEFESLDQEYEPQDTEASVYHNVRFNYLCVDNHDDITDRVKSMGVDISDACAMWFDEQVDQAVNQIVEGLKKLIK